MCFSRNTAKSRAKAQHNINKQAGKLNEKKKNNSQKKYLHTRASPMMGEAKEQKKEQQLVRGINIPIVAKTFPTFFFFFFFSGTVQSSFSS